MEYEHIKVEAHGVTRFQAKKVAIHKAMMLESEYNIVGTYITDVYPLFSRPTYDPVPDAYMCEVTVVVEKPIEGD